MNAIIASAYASDLKRRAADLAAARELDEAGMDPRLVREMYEAEARALYEKAKGPTAKPYDSIGNMARESWLNAARKQGKQA